MKRNLFQDKSAITSESDYLTSLGKHLTLRFPSCQVHEILADYQEYLSLEHGQGTTMEAIVAHWGSPRDVARHLLEECPEARTRLYKHSALWILLFLAAVYCLHYMPYGPYIFFIVGSLSIFGLLHLGEYAAIERHFSRTNHAASLPPAAIHGFLPLIVLLTEGLAQYATKYVTTLTEYITPYRIGQTVNLVSRLFQVLVLLLFLWMIAETVLTSVRYFPAAVHAMGVLLFIMDIRSIFQSMDLSVSDSDKLPYIFAASLTFYGTGLVLSVFYKLLLTIYVHKGFGPETLPPFQTTSGKK